MSKSVMVRGLSDGAEQDATGVHSHFHFCISVILVFLCFRYSDGDGMDIHWSPRKRIRLNGDPGKAISLAVVPVEPIHSTGKSPVGKTSGQRRNPLKRASTDFDKELDELLEQPDNGINATQMFLVDPDMELAMLRADLEQPASTYPEPDRKRSISRTLSRWDTAPLYDTTNAAIGPCEVADVKRHVSEPSTCGSRPLGLTQTNQLIDELDGIDITELTAAIDNAETFFASTVTTQDVPDPAQPEFGMFTFRCVVNQVPIYSEGGSGVGLKVTEEATGKTRFVTLEGVWRDAYLEDPWQVQEGDIIHVLASREKKWENDHVVIGDSETLFPDLIVFHPDSVLSSTTLSASATCHRRSVLQNRVLSPQVGPPSTDPDDVARSLSPIIGNCIHEAVQAAAAENDFSQKFVLEAGEKALNEQMLTGVWSSGSVPSAVINQLRNRLSGISSWGLVHWPRMAKRLLGCETEIRPKSLGLTGKLDMDIEDVIGARSCIEIKTGKHHAIHVGQVVLYYLLQYVDKYGNPNAELARSLPVEISQEFILLYLPASAEAESIKVKITARETQNIMRNRNLIASHNVRKTIPAPIYRKGDCQFCPSRRECAALYLDNEDADKSDSNRFFKATQYVRRDASMKKELLAYQRRWLEWVDQQQFSEQVGGLSAVRRMRGNVLHIVSNCLVKESGVHQGRDSAFYNWMNFLLGRQTRIVEGPLADWLHGYAPKTREGRGVCVVSGGDASVTAKRVVEEVVKPLLEKDERILLCGTSHGGIDSILSELLASGLSEDVLKRITRLASKPTDVIEGVRETMLLPENWMATVADIEASRLMFACTVKAVHHDILSRGDFGVAIVIDAHRVPDAALWGVLIRARQVVLVGDSTGEKDTEGQFLFKRLLETPGAPTVDWGPKAEVEVVELE